jgi:uroporphyrinogen decarboxylase
LQGNLDPCLLLAPDDVIDVEVRRVLAEGTRAPGHVFNLGHGVLPETDPDKITRVVELVHRYSARPASAVPGAEA